MALGSRIEVVIGVQTTGQGMEPADLGWRACECGGKGAGIRLLSFFFFWGGGAQNTRRGPASRHPLLSVLPRPFPRWSGGYFPAS